MKVAITGAGGYIGSVSTYLFLQNGFEVVAIDNFSTGFEAPLKLLQKKFGSDKLKFYRTDLRDDLKSVFQQEKGIDAVVHYAAHCSVNESMVEPGKYFFNNVGGSLALISAMIETGIKNVVFSSTCAVYGEADYVPVDEKHPTNPKNPYGESKLMVEKIIKWYGELKGLNYMILRYFNVCGASDDGLIGDSKKPSPHLMQNAVRGALDIEPFYVTCPKVDTTDGTPIRDYVNVVDLNMAHLKAVKYLIDGGTSEILNLGTGTGSSVLEIVHAVQKLTGQEFDAKQSTPRQGEYAVMIAASKKAKKVLDWQPERTIKQSVQSLLKWYKEHPQGWN